MITLNHYVVNSESEVSSNHLATLQAQPFGHIFTHLNAQDYHSKYQDMRSTLEEAATAILIKL